MTYQWPYWTLNRIQHIDWARPCLTSCTRWSSRSSPIDEATSLLLSERCCNPKLYPSGTKERSSPSGSSTPLCLEDLAWRCERDSLWLLPISSKACWECTKGKGEPVYPQTSQPMDVVGRDGHLLTRNVKGVGSVSPPLNQRIKKNIFGWLSGLQLNESFETRCLY